MKFASTRLVAADVPAMVAFYETLTAGKAEWLAPAFAEIVTPAATLAIGAAETVALFEPGSAEPKANRSAILEFIVADVDAEFASLKGKAEVAHAPKTTPWEIAPRNSAIPRARRWRSTPPSPRRPGRAARDGRLRGPASGVQERTSFAPVITATPSSIVWLCGVTTAMRLPSRMIWIRSASSHTFGML